MNVLVVGATGTLGPRAVRLLTEPGHDVVGVTTTEEKRPALEALGAASAVADLLDATAIRRVTDRVRPEAVVNLATRIPPAGPRRASQMRATNRFAARGRDI